jgi:hypothetical protein
VTRTGLTRTDEIHPDVTRTNMTRTNMTRTNIIHTNVPRKCGIYHPVVADIGARHRKWDAYGAPHIPNPSLKQGSKVWSTLRVISIISEFLFLTQIFPIIENSATILLNSFVALFGFHLQRTLNAMKAREKPFFCKGTNDAARFFFGFERIRENMFELNSSIIRSPRNAEL